MFVFLRDRPILSLLFLIKQPMGHLFHVSVESYCARKKQHEKRQTNPYWLRTNKKSHSFFHQSNESPVLSHLILFTQFLTSMQTNGTLELSDCFLAIYPLSILIVQFPRHHFKVINPNICLLKNPFLLTIWVRFQQLRHRRLGHLLETHQPISRYVYPTVVKMFHKAPTSLIGSIVTTHKTTHGIESLQSLAFQKTMLSKGFRWFQLENSYTLLVVASASTWCQLTTKQ